MSDQWTPTSIANRALDSAAIDFTMGDIEEGTKAAQVCRRFYSDCVRNLLRTAGWNFARRMAPLLCIADSTGQTPNVGTIVPSSQFLYSYAYPLDAAFVRYVPWFPFVSPAVPTGNITPSDPSAPIMEGVPQTWQWSRVYPARFLITSDQNNVPPDASNTAPGIAPTGRTVICANVPPSVAQVIYTYEAMYPNLWSSSFREAMIAYLAAEISVPLATDKKFGMQMRQENAAIARNKITDARVTDGNEGWHSSSLNPEWISFRYTGGYGNNGFNGPGLAGGVGGAGVGDWSCTWDSILINGSAY